MADYTQTTWVEKVTKVGPTRMNAIEAGLKDAAEHNKTGLSSARPAASSANKNWIWRESDTGRSFYSDGTSWLPLGGGVGKGAALIASERFLGTFSDPMTQTFTAQRFTAGRSGPLGMIRVKLKRDAAVDSVGTFSVFVYSANPDGSISSQIGYYGAIKVKDIGTTASILTARKGSTADTVTLVSGNKYFVVLRAISQVRNGGSIYWMGDDGGGDQTGYEGADGISWAGHVGGRQLGTYLMTPGGEFTTDGVADIAQFIDQFGTPVAAIDATGALVTAGGVGFDPALVAAPVIPTLINSWVNYGGIKYWRDGMGIVHIEGEIQPGSTTAGATIFTLPTGFRPLWRRYFLATGNVNDYGAFQVNTNGSFQVSDNHNLPGGNVWNLGHIAFATS